MVVRGGPEIARLGPVINLKWPREQQSARGGMITIGLINYTNYRGNVDGFVIGDSNLPVN